MHSCGPWRMGVMEDDMFNLRRWNWRLQQDEVCAPQSSCWQLELAELGMVMAAGKDRQPCEMVLPSLLYTGQRGYVTCLTLAAL